MRLELAGNTEYRDRAATILHLRLDADRIDEQADVGQLRQYSTSIGCKTCRLQCLQQLTLAADPKLYQVY